MHDCARDIWRQRQTSDVTADEGWDEDAEEGEGVRSRQTREESAHEGLRESSVSQDDQRGEVSWNKFVLNSKTKQNTIQISYHMSHMSVYITIAL